MEVGIDLLWRTRGKRLVCPGRSSSWTFSRPRRTADRFLWQKSYTTCLFSRGARCSTIVTNFSHTNSRVHGRCTKYGWMGGV